MPDDPWALDDELASLMAQTGARMRHRENEIGDAVTERLATLDLLAGDDPLRRMLGASVAANLSLIMQLATGVVTIDQVVVPAPAAAYAERLAQRGVSADRLVRAYFMAKNQVKHYLYDEVEQLDAARVDKLRVVHTMSDLFYQYIDKVTVALLEIHQLEESRWNQATGNVTSVMVHRVLAGEEPPDAFAGETGIQLDQHHVGLVLWTDDDTSALRELERASRELASRQSGGRIVFSALDPTTRVGVGAARQAGRPARQRDGATRDRRGACRARQHGSARLRSGWFPAHAPAGAGRPRDRARRHRDRHRIRRRGSGRGVDVGPR